MSLRSVPVLAFERFTAHDSWAIASHIAMSVLMSLFPFLILLTALGGVFGTREVADEATGLLFEAWPKEIAGPIAREVQSVLTARRGDALTFGAVLALYFASSGVEALRIGLNRAYEAYEWRAWWRIRLESVLYVLGGAVFMLGFAFLTVFGPLVLRGLTGYLPELAPLSAAFGLARVAGATALIALALSLAHRFLPARAPHIRALWPGILVTLTFWLIGGLGFGWYLDSFAGGYVTTYAGLATAMIALVFLYWLAAIFLYGAELNAAYALARAPKAEPGEPIGSL